MDSPIPQQLATLLARLRDEQLNAEEVAELERLVLTNAEARRWYVRAQALQAGLYWMNATVGEEQAPHEVAGETAPRVAATGAPAGGTTPAIPLKRHPGRRLLAAAAVFVAITGALLWQFLASTPAALATVTRVADVEEGADPWRPGAALFAGRVTLNAGMSEVTFVNGAVVLLEAPAELELLDRQHVFLHSGRVVVRVPPAAVGFRVETPRAKILDLGTEFGVGVGLAGDTAVQVFDGVVEADWKQADAAAAPQRLTAGQAMRVGADAGARPEALAFASERFLRRMPVAPETSEETIPPGSWLTPRNTSRLDAVEILPAPPGLVLDGDLSDWGPDGFFAARADEPFGQDYQVRAAMRYDRRFLYLGARVADPEPMRSIIDPNVDPNIGWKGGSVQVRLSTDRRLGWPLHAEWLRRVNGQPYQTAEDFNDKLVHVTMWYFRPADQPCLYLEYGMNLHGTKVNPPGWTGAFRRDGEGRGYTLEYAIPWNLLNAADDPPRRGDLLAACWLVQWSDSGGRRWRGHITEIRNPAETGVTHLKAATWGRAVYR